MKLLQNIVLDVNLTYGVGLSGGIDSVVLLHELYHNFLAYNLSLSGLKAVHINHGLSAYDDKWQQFCEHYCAELGVELKIYQLNLVKEPGQGLENTARKARYRAFSQLEDIDIIVLAHHQDDQYETMLSQIIRGSDLHNVAAMHEETIRYRKKIWRPLLAVSKTMIIAYAKFYSLNYVHDQSNNDNSYLRNFLRNEIIPSLLQYDAQVYHKLEALLLNIRHYLAIADEIASNDVKLCQLEQHPAAADQSAPLQLDWHQVMALSTARQINLLTGFIKTQCQVMVSHKQLQEFLRQCQQVSQHSTGSQPILQGAGFTLLFNKARLILLNKNQASPKSKINIILLFPKPKRHMHRSQMI